MRRLLVILALVSASFALPAPAFAACHWVTTVAVIDGHQQAQTTMVCPPEQEGGTESTGSEPPTDSGLDSICVATAISLGQEPYAFCLGPSDGTAATVRPGVVATAFQQVPLPPSRLEVQPPNGRTLVNFDTNFFSRVVAYSPPPITLLGQRVDLHLIPAEFTWHFGDGESSTTNQPGAPYPKLNVTHRYLRKGQVAPSVDTTWTATYSVNGGPWAPVPGTVTVTGETVDLQVLTATPTLVG